MQNTEDPRHDIARQQKPRSSQQEKLQRLKVNTKHQLNHKITEGKRNATTLTENMVEASSSLPSLSEMDNACLSSNSAINCKRTKNFQGLYLDNTTNLTWAIGKLREEQRSAD